MTINLQHYSLSQNSTTSTIDLYTDGSCHTQRKNGAWACIIFSGEKKIILQGVATDTTHQRMELSAVIKGLMYLRENKLTSEKVNVYTDSQYVADLLRRKERFITMDYLTKDQKPIRNADLVKELIELMENFPVYFTKVKAHQKSLTIESRFNREVDLLVRKKMRDDENKFGA